MVSPGKWWLFHQSPASHPPGPTSMAMSFTMCRGMCRAMAIACGVSAVAAVVAMATMAAMAMVLSTKDGKYRWKMMEKYGIIYIYIIDR